MRELMKVVTGVPYYPLAMARRHSEDAEGLTRMAIVFSTWGIMLWLFGIVGLVPWAILMIFWILLGLR